MFLLCGLLEEVLRGSSEFHPGAMQAFLTWCRLYGGASDLLTQMRNRRGEEGKGEASSGKLKQRAQ